MPTWGEILRELQESGQQNAGQVDFDGVRRKYLTRLQEHTERDTILYYSDWFSTSGSIVSITLEDMQGMMEVLKDLKGPGLDIILHSPGGDPDAAASIVRYLRTRFTHLRAFVPLAAMSAATMWALACDEIVMGKHSQLGPIDPQIVMGNAQWPARAVLEQFDRAKQECSDDPTALSAWLPILQQYAPALLELCETAEEQSRKLVSKWVATWMLPGDAKRAEAIASFFASYELHQSHGMGIDREAARSQGVVVRDLEDDQKLQDRVLSVHHATMHTFNGAAVKIVENHLGKAYVKIQQSMQVQMPMMMPPQLAGPIQPTS